METHPGEGVMKKKFPNSMKPSHRWVHGEFWNLRRQHNQEGKKENPQNMCLTASTCGEVAHVMVSASSKWGLGSEARAASLVFRVRIGLECPEDNLRELM